MEKAKFVLFEPKSGVILMTDGKELICNHTENSVRLVGKSKNLIKRYATFCNSFWCN